MRTVATEEFHGLHHGFNFPTAIPFTVVSDHFGDIIQEPDFFIFDLGERGNQRS